LRYKSFVFPRSACPDCGHILGWYDLIPVFSWFFLGGKCRYCKAAISWLYPFIEVFTALVMSALLVFVPLIYFPAYFLFFSALIVTIRTDIESMLILQIATLYLVPVGFLLSAFGFLPISFYDSLGGSLIGYGFLYVFAWVFKRLTGKEGIGAGDFDLLAFIGAFTGIMGCWLSLFLGSVIGSFVGLFMGLLGKMDRSAKIPFGPFLAIGAILYVLFNKQILALLFKISL